MVKFLPSVKGKENLLVVIFGSIKILNDIVAFSSQIHIRASSVENIAYYARCPLSFAFLW